MPSTRSSSKRKLEAGAASNSDGAPSSKGPKPALAPEPAFLDTFCPEIITEIVKSFISYKKISLRDVLHFSQTCTTVRKIVLKSMDKITEIDKRDFSRTLRTSCPDLNRPSVAFKKVEQFWTFLRKISPTIEKLYLPQVSIHFGPENTEIQSIQFQALKVLSLTICRPQDWDIIRTILANANIENLHLEAASNFCAVGCRECGLGADGPEDVDNVCDCHSGFLADTTAIADLVRIRGAQLRALKLANWHLKDGSSCDIWKAVPGLKALDISECFADFGEAEGISESEAIHNLEELRIKSESFNYSDQPDVFGQLKTLQLSDEVFDDTISPIPRNLTHLYVSDSADTEILSETLRRWISETHGQVTSVIFDFEHTSQLDDRMLDTLIERNPNLTELVLKFYLANGLTDAGFRKLHTLRNLRHFAFVGSGLLGHEVSSQAWDVVTPETFPNLNSLTFYSNADGSGEVCERMRESFNGKCTVAVGSPFDGCDYGEFLDDLEDSKILLYWPFPVVDW